MGITRGGLEPLSLQLFGSPCFLGEDAARASELLARPKALGLLAYLAIALPLGLHRRDELLALFWPDSDSSHARNALRQSLHLQRSSLPAGSLITRGKMEVGIESALLRIDVRTFEDHLDHGREANALALYRGELLNGFSLSEIPEFDAWLSVERERLHRRAVRGALILATEGEQNGDRQSSAKWAQFALDMAPFDENLLRDVIEIRVRSGDNGGAAHAYVTAGALFREKLGIALSPETMRLGASLSGDESALPREGGVQREVVQRALPLTAASAAAFVRPRVVSPEARQAYLEGKRVAAERSPVTILKSIESFELAIRLSPQYAEAHSALSTALMQAAAYIPYPGNDAWPRARTHALRAINLDPQLGDAYAILAHVTVCYDYDWTLAEKLYLRALHLDPTSVGSRASYALYFLSARGRFADALSVLNRARDDFPDISGLSLYYAMVSVFAREYDQALREANFVLDSEPSSVQGHWVRGSAQEGMGDLDGAVQTFERGVELTNRSALFLSLLGRACARRGDTSRATAILRELDQRGDEGGPGMYFGAEIFAAMANPEAAIDRLYAVYRQRNPAIVFAGVRFGLDPLRGNRRFKDLLMRLGLSAFQQTVRR